MNSFYSNDELKGLGLKKIGNNVLISRKVSIYAADKISIGDNVRIDDFCILSGKITLGNYIHISAYTGIFAGNAGVELKDFVTVSSRCVIYAISDDYSGEYLTNPMIDDEYINVQSEKVVLEEHAIIGTGSTILPGVIVGEGVAVGAMSLVKNNIDPWGIYIGVPCEYIKPRSKHLLKLKADMLYKNKL